MFFIAMRRWWQFVWLAAALLAMPGWAQQAVPALNGRVVDTAQMLSEAERLRIDAQLAQVEQKRGSQVVALLVASTAPEDIASYANRVANEWKLGRKQVGDGILIIIARDDRRLRIEVAKALEGAVPDLAAKQIIDSALVPALRQGRTADGLQAAIAQLDARIGGENLPAPDAASGGLSDAESGFQWMDLLIFLFFASLHTCAAIAKNIFGNKLGSIVTAGAFGAMTYSVSSSLWVAAGGFLLALVISIPVSSMSLRTVWGQGIRRGSRAHGGGWSSGSSSGGWGGGGGFSSGGGGDFGGGGASGDW